MRHVHKLSRVTLACAAAAMLFAFPACGDDDAEDKAEDAMENAEDAAEDLKDAAGDLLDGK